MRYQPVTPEIVHELSHIVGVMRLEVLPLVMDEVVIALHRRIKAACDPNHVLNPGKIFEQANV
jgi:FAD/FMN-containing dehydrogenase